MSIFSSLRREQKEAIGLLQIGTFLEYFDLLLYVHMTVFLNDLFFPKTDPHTAAIFSALAFCSTFVFRPFGALIFGYLGDTIGRKTTVIITTMMMALSCAVMAVLPTYAQIGISAAWIVTLCRMVQGLSSIGEVVGAEIYLTEIIKPPANNPIVASLMVFSTLGGTAALLLATFVTSYGFNWRNAFWFGACIALVGSVARIRLRETPEFADMKRRVKNAIEESNHYGLKKAAELLKSTNPIWKEKVSYKTSLALLSIHCGVPVCFYFSYIHCGGILKTQFGYTSEQVIQQNLLISIIQLLTYTFLAVLSYKIHPLKILRAKIFFFAPFVVLCPYLLENLHSSFDLFLLQVFSITFMLTDVPAAAILIKNIPIFKRFTYTSFLYALSRAIIYVITSFGLVYLTDWFSHYGLWVIMVPITSIFIWGLHHFENLEKQFADQPPRSDHPFSMKPLTSIE